MGDWCGPKSDTDRLKTGVRDLDNQTADELNQREKKEILLRGKVCAYLTCRLPSNSTTLLPVVQLRSGVILLMGDPVPVLPSPSCQLSFGSVRGFIDSLFVVGMNLARLQRKICALF